MNLFPIIGWLRSNTSVQISARIACLSRGLLFVIALEIITMPVTQNLWTWDRFLHGGQDFELGMLIIVTCLCLTLLRAEQGKCDLGLLVAIRALLFKRHPRNISRFCSSPHSCEHRLKIPTASPTPSFNIPLLI